MRTQRIAEQVPAGSALVRAAESDPLSQAKFDRRAALGIFSGCLLSLSIGGCKPAAPKPSTHADPRAAEIEDCINSYLFRELVPERYEAYGRNWRAELHWDIMTQNYPYHLTVREEFSRSNVAKEIAVVFCDREAGLERIRKAFVSHAKEHSFVYIPALEAWIDDTQSASWESTSGDPYLRLALLAKYPVVELMHTHPTPTLEREFREGVRGEHYLITGALPSSGDFVSHIQQHQKDSRRMIGCVISHYGVCSYEFTKECLEHKGLAAIQGGEMEGVRVDADPRLEIQRLAQLHAEENTWVSEIELNEGRKVPGFELRFVPFY